MPRITTSTRTGPVRSSSRSPGLTSLLGFAATPLTFTRPSLTASAASARVLDSRAAHSHLSIRIGSSMRSCFHAVSHSSSRRRTARRASTCTRGDASPSARSCSATAPAAASARRTSMAATAGRDRARRHRRARRAALPRRRPQVPGAGAAARRRLDAPCSTQLQLAGRPADRRRPLLRRARRVPHRGRDRRDRRALPRVPAAPARAAGEDAAARARGRSRSPC